MRSDTTTKASGDEGERLATLYLENKGYTILEQNYRFEEAEIDIVAYCGQEIIFVEVKRRTNLSFGRPEDAVTEDKKRRIAKAAEAWLYERKMDGAPVRFDVIAILSKSETEHKVRHFENAFTYV